MIHFLGIIIESNGLSKSSHENRRSLRGRIRSRITVGSDNIRLKIRLWREKRGEARPEDFSKNPLSSSAVATEDLNRHWYEVNTGQIIKDKQRRVRHPVIRWMAATLDGIVEASGAVFEAKFMLPWSFSEEAAAEKHMAQLQHNMWVVASRCYSLGRAYPCLPVLQADPWATAIFFDEFNTSGFKRTPYDLDSRSSRSGQSCFQLPNSNDSNPGPFGETLLAPVQESARCSALCWGHHGCAFDSGQFCRKTIDLSILSIIVDYVVFR